MGANVYLLQVLNKYVPLWSSEGTNQFSSESETFIVIKHQMLEAALGSSIYNT